MFTTIQKRNQFLMVLAVSLLAWCMPCFSFNPQMTGYRWGVSLAGYTGLQLLAAGWLCLEFWQKQSRWIWALVLCLLLTAPMAYLVWLPTWHTAFITGKISWEIGFSTVYPGYWIALALSFLPPLAFLLLKQKRR